MSYTITSAAWSNSDQTSAVLQTVESGAVLVSLHRPDLWLQFVEWSSTPGNTVAAYAQPDMTALLRAAAKAILATGTGEQAKKDRAIVAILLDEINDLRAWITSFKAATAAATTLADFKTRVAALSNMPARTMAQAKTKYEAMVDSGKQDSRMVD